MIIVYYMIKIKANDHNLSKREVELLISENAKVNTEAVEKIFVKVKNATVTVKTMKYEV